MTRHTCAGWAALNSADALDVFEGKEQEGDKYKSDVRICSAGSGGCVEMQAVSLATIVSDVTKGGVSLVNRTSHVSSSDSPPTVLAITGARKHCYIT